MQVALCAGDSTHSRLRLTRAWCVTLGPLLNTQCFRRGGRLHGTKGFWELRSVGRTGHVYSTRFSKHPVGWQRRIWSPFRWSLFLIRFRFRVDLRDTNRVKSLFHCCVLVICVVATRASCKDLCSSLTRALGMLTSMSVVRANQLFHRGRRPSAVSHYISGFSPDIVLERTIV